MKEKINQTKIRCSNLPCSQKSMPYHRFISKHALRHIEKEILCPLGCKEMLTNEKNLQHAIQHYKHCQVLTRFCQTCGIVHFPNENDQMECVAKMKEVIEKRDESIQQLEQEIELQKSVIKFKDLFIVKQDKEIQKHYTEIQLLNKKVKLLKHQIMNYELECKNTEKSIDNQKSLTSLTLSATTSLTRSTNSFTYLSTAQSTFQLNKHSSDLKKLQKLLKKAPSGAHESLTNAWNSFSPLSVREIIQKSGIADFNIDSQEINLKSDDRGQCYAVGQHKAGTNKLHGIGRWVNKCVWIGEGMWLDGWLNGYGRSLYIDGEYYLGMWKQGQRDGYGTEISARGEVRQGIWRQGTFKGKPLAYVIKDE